MKENRKKCILCDGKLNELYTLKMPLFMGVKHSNINETISDMTFKVCNDCGEVQIGELIDLNVIYQNNHNIDVVGEIWENHYIELAEFIKESINDKVILEISDPSCKIAKLSENFKHWYIVEPNHEPTNIKNVEFIDAFFDDNFNTINNVDVIIHSHLLEHIHDPNSFFQKCYEILNDDGEMIISIPNMNFLLNEKYSPNNILHFEHTFYINNDILNYLANKNGFEVIQSVEYKNHSNFYRLKKVKTPINKKLQSNISKEFKQCLINHIEHIKTINTLLSTFDDYEVYIFGAHVSTQYYLFNGLDSNNIIGILDNSKSKQGFKLYGTELLTYNPEIIKDKKAIVICTHTGVYFNEIYKQLSEINKNIIIL